MELAEQQDTAAIIQTLQDAGCDAATIESFIKLASSGDKKATQHLLSVHRSRLLCKIHEAQKPLDALDYLIFMLKRKGE